MKKSTDEDPREEEKASLLASPAEQMLISSPEDGSGRSNYSPLLDYKYQRIQMREEERKKSPKPSARRPSP